jgi:hypothetical protein
MKIKIYLLFISMILSYVHSKSNGTPQGVNLKNHFGLPTVEEKFGPKTDNYDQYVQANPDTFVPFSTFGQRAVERATEFVPYPGYEKKINPHFIKSGEMSNIAPSAKSIINPQITGPKLQVRTQMEYPAVVRLPTFVGMKKEWKSVKAYNKETGQLVDEKVLVEYPKMVNQDHVRNIPRTHEQFIDLRNGTKIVNTELKVNHGIEEKQRRRFM